MLIISYILFFIFLNLFSRAVADESVKALWSTFQHHSSENALSSCPQIALPVTPTELVLLLCFACVGLFVEYIGAIISFAPPNLVSLKPTRG